MIAMLGGEANSGFTQARGHFAPPRSGFGIATTATLDHFGSNLCHLKPLDLSQSNMN